MASISLATGADNFFHPVYLSVHVYTFVHFREAIKNINKSTREPTQLEKWQYLMSTCHLLHFRKLLPTMQTF